MSKHELAQPQRENAPPETTKFIGSLQRRDMNQLKPTTLQEWYLDTVSGTIAEPRFGYNFSRVPTHTGMVRETQPLLHTQTTVQRFPKDGAGGSSPCPTCPEAEPTEISEPAEPAGETIPTTETTEPATEPTSPGGEATPTPGEPKKESAVAGETPASALIVEDSAADLAPGQMRKSDFLAQLRTEVTRAAEEAMAGTDRTTKDCPYLEYWFGFYSKKDSAHIERAIHKYAPETRSATSARDYIPIVAARVRRSVEVWARTGEITGLPEGLPMGLSAMGLLGGVGKLISGIGSIFFKARAGGARKPDDPQSIQKKLGKGQPLDSNVRSRMESAFGMDFAHVRTHTDSTAVGLSDRMNARAFTVGEHVAFGAGEYKPGTLVGDAIIAHELAHVMQQSGGAESAAQMKGGDVTYNNLEKDADKSAIGAVVSLFGGAKDALSDISQNAIPSLRSGLRLQRCDKEDKKRETKEKKMGILRINGPTTVDHYCAPYKQPNDLKSCPGEIFPAPNITLEAKGVKPGQPVKWSIISGKNKVEIVGSRTSPTVTIKGKEKSKPENDVAIQVEDGSNVALHRLSVLEPTLMTSVRKNPNATLTLIYADLVYTVRDQFKKPMGAGICIDETMTICYKPKYLPLNTFKFKDVATNNNGQGVDNLYVTNSSGIPKDFCVKIDQELTAGGCGPLLHNIILMQSTGITVTKGNCKANSGGCP